MKSKRFGLLFSACCLAALGVGTLATRASAQNVPAQSEAAACQRIVSRYRQGMLEGKLPDMASIKGWMGTLDAQGQWPDIDYANQDPSSWKPMEHMKRLAAMSRALADTTSPLHDDTALQSATLRALDLWTAKRPQARNWFFNQVAVPMLMRDTTILLDTRLTGDRRMGALAVWHQYGHLSPGGGANTIWTAELGLEYGAFVGDSAIIAPEARIISGEIKVTKGEGIQSNSSFHEHGARLQQFHYGGAFISDAARLAWELHGTPWALPDATLQLVADTVLQGSQWMCRGTRTVPSTVDRAVSRPDSMGAGLQDTARHLRETVPQDAAALDALLARQDGTGASVVGFRSYPRSDFSVYQRPEFSFFLKTVSDRTLTSEQGTNGENLKGQNLSCGDQYILRDGDEYDNLQPVWNWHLLPGVTWADGAGEVQRRPFVGAVGDGSVGATAMDYAFGTAAGPTLTARKFWACDGNAVVCLIGGLRANGLTAPVQTALDQCRLRGPVTVGKADGTTVAATAGTIAPEAVRWVHHAGLAYIPLEAQPVSLRLGPAIGAWYDINHGYSHDPVTAPVFLPILEQGVSPAGKASGFAVVSCATPHDAATAAAKPTWHILSNTANCQALRFDDGAVMTVFYQPGTVQADGKTLFAVDYPCLLLQSSGQLRACDPTQKGGVVHITRADGSVVAFTLPPGGLVSDPVH